MCRRVSCPTCGKATYEGCGEHIEEALAGVPRSERCACPPQAAPAQRSIVSRFLKR